MLVLLKFGLSVFYLLGIHGAMAQQDTVFIRINFEKMIALAAFQVNGHEAVFILDTGSSISLFDQQLAKEYGVHYDRSEADGWIVGLGGKQAFSHASGVNLNYNNEITFKHQFFTADISHVSAVLKQRRITIAGILGADFFIKNKVIINYNDRYLVVYQNISESHVKTHGR